MISSRLRILPNKVSYCGGCQASHIPQSYAHTKESTIDLDANLRYLYTVTEFLPGGDLLHLLLSHNTPLGQKFRIGIARGAAAGLAFLHTNKIIHRDIKNANIVLDCFYNAKITDFGFARVSDSFDSETRRMTICGTDCPEIYRNRLHVIP